VLWAAAVICCASAAPVAAGAIGQEARTIYLSDSGHLHLTSHPRAFILNESGTATGTIRGPLYIHLHIVSTNRVTAEVNVYPRNGSLTGHASASYRSGAGSVATFSGTMSVVGGSGAYAHAHASALSFSGTIARSNDAVTVHVSGRLGL
jgi:hypothetical protein